MKYIFLCDLQHFHEIIDFSKDIYKKNTHVKDKYYQLCDRYGFISQLTIKIGLAAYIPLVSIFVLLQLIDSIQKGELKPCLFIYFPFGFEYSQPLCLRVIMFLYNFLFAASIITILVPVDILFFLIFLNIPLTSEILQEHLLELNRSLEKARISEDAIKRRLLEYLEMHKKHIE